MTFHHAPGHDTDCYCDVCCKHNERIEEGRQIRRDLEEDPRVSESLTNALIFIMERLHDLEEKANG